LHTLDIEHSYSWSVVGAYLPAWGKSVTDSNNATVEIGLGVVKAFEDAINRHDFDVILLAT